MEYQFVIKYIVAENSGHRHGNESVFCIKPNKQARRQTIHLDGGSRVNG